MIGGTPSCKLTLFDLKFCFAFCWISPEDTRSRGRRAHLKSVSLTPQCLAAAPALHAGAQASVIVLLQSLVHWWQCVDDTRVFVFVSVEAAESGADPQCKKKKLESAC